MPKAFLFGVGGGAVKPEQTKTVDLSMAMGNQIVLPDTGKVLTQVTVNKPPSLIPDNIKKDITIGGVTGTYAGGSADGDYIVTYRDLDGTILKQDKVDEGGTSTPPDNPNYDSDYLIFNKWTDIDLLTNITRNIDISAIYSTVDNAAYYFFELDSDNLDISFSIDGTITNIDYGDGATGTNTIYTYNSRGNYVVKITGNITNVGTTTKISGDGNIYLKKVYIPNGVTSIGSGAFQNCSSLTNINIPDSVTSIGSSAFQNCSSLTNINIPNSVTSIGSSAFQNCFSLANINIPNGVTSIGSSAFQYCYSLTNINIPDSVTSIGSSAFQYCSSLVNINIPNSVTSIGRSAFQTCYSLTNINIPNSVTSIGSSAFQYCYSLANINIPNGVTSIGEYAFQNCFSLANINIPNGVTSIGSGAFSSCFSFVNINIPDSVTSIGSSAFQNCSSLTKINIPNGVTSIGRSAFQTCYSLTKLILNCTSVPSLSNTSAIPSHKPPIYVLDELVDSYKNATNWSSFANLIRPISELQ